MCKLTITFFPASISLLDHLLEPQLKLLVGHHVFRLHASLQTSCVSKLAQSKKNVQRKHAFHTCTFCTFSYFPA